MRSVISLMSSMSSSLLSAVVLPVLLAALLTPVARAADAVAEPAAKPEAVPPVPASEAPSAPSAELDKPVGARSGTTLWPHVTIGNASATVELSTYRASVARMRLLSEHPVQLPKWRTEGEKIDSKEPLAVLDRFRPEYDMHNLVEGMGLAAEPATEGAWQITEQAPDACTMTFSKPELGLGYSMSYRMDAKKPQVHVVLKVRNLGEKPAAVTPRLRPIDGIHQDDPIVEAGYQKAVVHSGGATGSLDHFGFPRDGIVEKFPKGIHPDYFGLKSRFFASWYTPEGVILREADAQVPADSFQETSYRGFLNETPAGIYSQAEIDVIYGASANLDPFTLKSGAELDVSWALGVTAMTHAELAKLDDAEKRLEFTDAYYSFFKSLAKLMAWMLNLIAHVVHYYGVAVILLTFLVKALMHRFTYKQYESTMKMQKLQPELKYLQEQYKADKQKLAMKQMELWKKHGVNPLGGCLPIFIQIPIFMGLYQMFSHLADLRGQSFLWVRDLTLPDQVWYLGFHWPFFGALATINPLPLIYIGVTVWMSMMQKPPSGGDPQQEQMFKMMRWLPVIFGVIFYNMPAGLVLYFTVQAVLSTIEIKMVKRKLGMK